MNELQELTDNKTLPELEKELDFQVNHQGESLGGTICSHIVHAIEMMKKEGRSGASLIEETVFTKKKGINTYYIDRISNGKFTVSLDEFYKTTFETKEKAIEYIENKCK